MSFEGTALLAMSIDKEEMSRLVCISADRGAGCWILGTLSLVECKAVSPGLCAYLLLFGRRLINISRAALAASLLELSHVNRSHACDTTPLLLLRAACGRAVSVRARCKHGKLLEMESVGDARQSPTLLTPSLANHLKKEHKRHRQNPPIRRHEGHHQLPPRRGHLEMGSARRVRRHVRYLPRKLRRHL